MAVYNATPGKITGVSVANPGKISSVGTAKTGNITGTVRNYGMQQQPYMGAPTSIRVGGSPVTTPKIQSPVDKAMAEWQRFLRDMNKPTPTPVAAVYDVAGANARARKAATTSQNPLYNKYLNEFLSNAKLQQKQEQQKFGMISKGLEQDLANTREDVGVGKTRTTEDVAQNKAQINTSEDEFQTDTGTRDAINRIEEARQVAQSGKTGGLGAQAAEASQANRNTTEKRQGAEFNQKRQEQDIFKARTFEDLSKTESRAVQGEKAGKEKAKFDLDVYISQYGVGKNIAKSGYQVKKFAQENEQRRLQAVGDAEAKYNTKYFNEFLTKLKNPGQITATRAKYGY
jgi:hypothetical protein